MPKRKAPAPPDAACGRAWDKIMRIAEDHALIVSAYGGMAVLAMPEEQRTQPGLRARCLLAAGMEEPSGKAG